MATSRRWVFTINNFTVEDELGVLALDGHSHIRYVCYGREHCTEEKVQDPMTEEEKTAPKKKPLTPHIQGYLECWNAMRLAGVSKLLPRASIRRAFGSAEQNQTYTSKEDNSWIQFGTPMPGRGTRSDLHHAMDMIHEHAPKIALFEECPLVCAKYPKFIQQLTEIVEKEETKEFRQVETHVYWGEAGTGKTARAMNEENRNVFTVNPDESFPFEGYDGEEAILIDDFYGDLKYHQLLRVLDGHQLRVNVKGAHRYARWKRVYITSNKHPNEWYKKGLTPALKRRISSVTEFRHQVEGNNIASTWCSTETSQSTEDYSRNPSDEEINDLLNDLLSGGSQN